MATEKADDNRESMPADLDPVAWAADLAPDLKFVIGFIIVALACIYVPVIDGTVFRPALGLALILFIPGYALVSALFPGKNDISMAARAVLSVGLSIAATSLVGLGLNYTPWGIRLEPVVACLTILTLICTLLADKGRRALKESERFSVSPGGIAKGIHSEIFAGNTWLDKALTLILVASIVSFACLLAYFLVVPRQGENSTGFYVLGPDRTIDGYAKTITMGDPQPVIVGIANHEHGSMTYDLVVSINNGANVTRLYTEQVTLSDNQTWEKKIDLKPDRAGTNLETEFLLYSGGNMTAPYRELHLWFNVTPPS